MRKAISQQFVFVLLVITMCTGCNKNDSGPFVDSTDKFIITNKTSINGISVEFKSCGTQLNTGIVDTGGTLTFSCKSDHTYTATLKATKTGEYDQTWTGEFVGDAPAGTFNLELQNSGIVLVK